MVSFFFPFVYINNRLSTSTKKKNGQVNKQRNHLKSPLRRRTFFFFYDDYQSDLLALQLRTSTGETDLLFLNEFRSLVTLDRTIR